MDNVYESERGREREREKLWVESGIEKIFS
jgi:hypothetical protein